jgi:hypothetical protein
MSLDLSGARQLCTQRELALVTASQPSEMSALTSKRLQANVVRARNLRDKFRDLSRRQIREARGTISPRGMRPARGNANTVKKARLFDAVVVRFEGRLTKLEKLERAGSTRALATRKQTKLKRSHIPRAKAHVAARNRRNQAQRDAR